MRATRDNDTQPVASKQTLTGAIAELPRVADVARQAPAQADLLALTALERALWGSAQTTWHWRAGDDELALCDFATARVDVMTMRMAEARCLIHPDDRLGVVLAWNNHVFGSAPFYAAEFRVSHDPAASAPRWRWVSERGRALARDRRGMALVLAGTRSLLPEMGVESSQRNLVLLAKALDHTSDGCACSPQTMWC